VPGNSSGADSFPSSVVGRMTNIQTAVKLGVAGAPPRDELQNIGRSIAVRGLLRRSASESSPADDWPQSGHSVPRCLEVIWRTQRRRG
jgi:hypothetical protein